MKRLSRRARRLLALALSLAVLASAAGLVISLRGNRAQAASASGSAQADLSQMQAALSSGSTSQQAALLAPPLRFAPHSGPVFPAGTEITILPGTLRTAGRFGTVTARTSGGQTVTLGLYAAGGHWRLYAVKAGSAQTRAAIAGQPASAQLASSVSTDTIKLCPRDTGDIGHKVPVVFVHGFFGKAADWGSDLDAKSMFSAVDTIPGTWTSAFDYSRYNGEWVANPEIGPRLVDYLNCVAAASSAAGGPGKVLVIGHSMGGLAARWAAANGAKDSIGEVITLGTPNTGANVAGLADSFRQLFCDTQSLLAVATFGQPGTGNFCPEFTALSGMDAFGGQIASLPELPPDIPLYAIAEDVTITGFLGGATVDLQNGSDTLVTVPSALYQPPGGGQFRTSVVACVFSLKCWHGSMPQNAAIQADVRGEVATYVRAHYSPQASQGQPVSGHPAGPDGNDPLNVVYNYYDALNRHDWQAAWDMGGSNIISSGNLADLAGSYSATRSLYVTGKDLTAWTGQPGKYVVRVIEKAYQTDGATLLYAGTYTVSWDGSRWMIVAADLQDLSGTGLQTYCVRDPNRTGYCQGLPWTPPGLPGSSGGSSGGQLNGGPAATVHGVVEPSQVVFSGDASNVVDHLTWTGWGTAQATATGQFEYESCVPDCGHGPVTPYPAKVVFSAPDANREYTRVSEIIESGPFSGQPENNSPVTATWPYAGR